MNIGELEQKAWKLDGVRIVVRAQSGAQVVPYTKTNAAGKRDTVTGYIKTRIKPCVTEFEVIIVNGNGEIAHGGTYLRKVRESYKK